MVLFVYKDAVLNQFYFLDDEVTFPLALSNPINAGTYLYYGRGISELLLYVSMFLDKHLGGTVQFAHLLGLLLLCSLFCLIFLSLRRVWGEWKAFAFSVAVACLPSFQIHAAYGRIFTYAIGYILTYFAVEVVSSRRGRSSGGSSSRF